MIAVFVREAGGHLADSLRAKALEWVCTLAAFMFGYSLAQPADTFALSPSYAMMDRMVTTAGLTENAVGWLVMGFAIIRFAVLGYNGLWHSSPIARRWMAFASALLWWFIFMGFWAAVGFAATGAGSYLAFLVGEVISTIRCSYEVGKMPSVVRGRSVDAAHSRH